MKWFCNHAPLSILDLILSSFGSYWECSPFGVWGLASHLVLMW
ncbi:hypothetical protein GLYMA_02G172151v4 [Glycine max]|nr:hypothetical protein GLYMA_02G172151v4 [Glycine max]KAH1060776.1 hypothetical protein GYH30_004303 [Glycine max]